MQLQPHGVSSLSDGSCFEHPGLPILEQPLQDGEEALETLLDCIGAERSRELLKAAARLSDQLGESELWHVNSTATGGGVAELLARVLPIYRSLGVNVHWAVVAGPTPFFDTTKALGLALYGDGSGLSSLEESHGTVYAEHGVMLGEALLKVAGESPTVILHDHQTVSMAPALRSNARYVIWRRHIGVDRHNDASTVAEAFLRPFVKDIDARIFSIADHITESSSSSVTWILPPVIDPSAPKHAPISPRVESDLVDKLKDLLRSQSAEIGDAGNFDWRHPLAVQISRWDRLKDMHGLIADFAENCSQNSLIVAGPDPASIPDDPDQPEWFRKALEAWQRLTPSQRQRVGLLRLPMEDPTSNALLVNALQRSADVVVQRSIAEGFGLTVTEAMWKFKTVVGADVGGIRAQIRDGSTGLLVRPGHSMGPALNRAQSNAAFRERIGGAAHQHVKEHFLADTDIIETCKLLDALEMRS